MFYKIILVKIGNREKAALEAQKFLEHQPAKAVAEAAY